MTENSNRAREFAVGETVTIDGTSYLCKEMTPEQIEFDNCVLCAADDLWPLCVDLGKCNGYSRGDNKCVYFVEVP